MILDPPLSMCVVVGAPEAQTSGQCSLKQLSLGDMSLRHPRLRSLRRTKGFAQQCSVLVL